MSNDTFTTSQPPIPRNTSGALSPPLPTPTHGAFGSFAIISSIHIAAPPDTTFAALLDHTSYPSWNRFVQRVTITSSPAPSDPPLASASSPELERTLAQDDGSKYIQKGTRMNFEVHMDLEPGSAVQNTNLEVTVLEPYGRGEKGWRIAWKMMGMPGVLLKTERVQEFVDDGKGGTEYTCWETMGGALAPVVKWSQGAKLEKGFQAWGEGLKAQAEKLAAGN